MKKKNARPIVSFDWAIKTILRDKANAGVLEGFLSALLKRDITVIELLESESNQTDNDAKYNRVDLLAKTETDERIIVEVQYESEHGYMKRLAYGAGKAIVENLQIGEPYGKVKKVYSVSLLHFDVGEGDDYVYHGRNIFTGLHTQKELKPKERLVGNRELHINDGNVFPEYFLIPLRSFGDKVKDRLDQWVYAFKNNEVLEEFDAPKIELLKAKLDYLSMSAEEKRGYDGYMGKMATLHGQIKYAYEEGMEQGMEQGIEQGMEKGIEQGMEKGVKQTALTMLKRGYPAREIADLTGLPLVEVERMENEE